MACLEDNAESVYIDSGRRKSSDVLADVHWPAGSPPTTDILLDNNKA